MLAFRGGVYDGGKVGGTRAWLGRALWGEALLAAGKQRSPHSEGCQWLLMFGGRCVAGSAYGSIGGKKGRGLGGPFGVGLF